MRAPPCAMIVTFAPVLPYSFIGMSPDLGLAGFAYAPVRLVPVKAPPTNVLRFIISPLPAWPRNSAVQISIPTTINSSGVMAENIYSNDKDVKVLQGSGCAAVQGSMKPLKLSGCLG